MKLLFVCNLGENRSRTAKELFSGKFDTESCGAYDEKNRMTAELLDWADVIFVMEEHHRSFISRNYPKQYMAKRIINLGVPDSYRYNQPELIGLLKTRINKWLKVIK